MAKRTTSNRRKKSSKKNQGGIIALLNSWILLLRTDPEAQEKAKKVSAWTLIFFSVLAFLACLSYFHSGNADQSAVEGAGTAQNLLGKFGAVIADLLVRRGFGIFGILLSLYGLFVGLVMLEDEYFYLARKAFKYVIFSTLWGSVFLAYIVILLNAGADSPTSLSLGGGFGHFFNEWMFTYINKVGMAFFILFSILIFVVVTFNAEVKASKLVAKIREKDLSFSGKFPFGKQLVKSGEAAASGKQKRNRPIKTRQQAEDKETSPQVLPNEQPPQLGEELSFELKDPQGKIVFPKKDEELAFEINQPEGDKPIIPVEKKEYERQGEDNVGVVKGEETGEVKLEKIVPGQDQETGHTEEVVDWEEFDPTKELSDYEPPMLELLDDHGAGKGREVSRDELVGNKNKIVETLGNYGIEIVNIKATIGPTVTLYEIVPAPGVRISKIRNLEDDIALNLAALGIRIIAPIPGKGTIGIEVPNSKREIVSLRGVLSTEKFFTTRAELPIAIGRTISNEVYIADLNKMPHLLIAGATGQGKSVGLNTIIASLLYKKHPAEVKFVLIDPKKVEMSLFQVLSNHFLAMMPSQEEPIITDVRDAVNVLKCLCIEMDQRYELLKKARVRNLKEYNTKFKNRKLNPYKGHRFMPYIVLVIDELADMMMIAGKEVEMPIARLAQLARAIGIHLVVATQRPSVNVITGIIKANFPARMSYRVISKVDSRTILDANGADQLIGRGDCLLSTGSEIIRLQNAFIDTPEVERLVDYISRQRGFPEPYYLPDVPSEDGDAPDDDEPFEMDSRFSEAARLIVKYQIGSASLIQRKMKLGYNRAGRIIDQLERANIVGPHSGSKARDVLIQDEAELERYLKTLMT
ncbi:MAG: DNA translocase FtsK [Bacteroidetes bacterium]|nr:MAG: DNA translocase FtsK [Bacteroidota bacterium]